MRWSFVICLLLVSAVIAKPRPKRSLGYIKSLIANKLFGSNTVVVARPILTNNQTYQLFKIPGYNDIVIKVTRKDKTEKDNVKPDDAVIVTPEVAIIGSYLGTTTLKETLLAIEMVKRLLKAGILSGRFDNFMQELLVPTIPQPHLKYFEDQHLFMPIPQVQNSNVIPMYPVEYPSVPVSPVGSVQPKYFYKQKGKDADMTYESYNNEDVIVTRTEKESALPKIIKMRLANVATIGANPYAARQILGVNGAPIPVPYYVNPGTMAQNVPGSYYPQTYTFTNGVQSEHIGSVHTSPVGTIGGHYNYPNNVQKVILCKEKIGKNCLYENTVKNSDQKMTSKVLNKPNQLPETSLSINYANKANKNGNDASIQAAVNEFLKNYTVNGQLTSQYVYKQINHHSNDNYTEVKVGEAPRLTNDITVETSTDLSKNYVYLPPKDVESSMLNVLSMPSKNSGNVQKQDDKNAFISKIKTNEGTQYAPALTSFRNEKTNAESLEHYPIVVSEQYTENREIENVNTNNFENRRGDIPCAS